MFLLFIGRYFSAGGHFIASRDTDKAGKEWDKEWVAEDDVHSLWN